MYLGDQGHIGEVPDKILGRLDFIKGHKKKGLYKYTERKISVEFFPASDNQNHLGSKHQKALHSFYILKILINVQEIHRKVVSIIFSNKMIQ